MIFVLKPMLGRKKIPGGRYMHIPGINSGTSLYNQSSIHKFTKIQTSVASEIKNTYSTVNISEKGKELYRIDGQVDPNDPKVKADLEALALPDWFVELLPKEAILNPSIGTPLRESTHYTDTGINKKEISYCMTKLSDVFCEEALKTGISSDERYYMKTSESEQFLKYDEKLHQAVRDRLLEDGQYVKYMEYLGITI